MCLNCGCGEPENRHKATDITADDVRKASTGGPLDKTVQNMRASLEKMGQSGTGQQGSSSGQSSTGQQSGSGQQGSSSGQSGSGQQGGGTQSGY